MDALLTALAFVNYKLVFCPDEEVDGWVLIRDYIIRRIREESGE